MQVDEANVDQQTYAYALQNISVSLTAVFGRSTLQMKDLMQLKTGDTLPIGEQNYPEVEILLNGKPFGCGEITENDGVPVLTLKSFVWNR
jgi:flagellar motor switch/type III secretory pathway protein FliN